MKPTKMQFTKAGWQKVQDDFKQFTEKRKEAVVRLRTAREMGDLSENGAYKAARFELGAIDRELRQLTYLLRVGEIAESNNQGVVDFGRRITLGQGEKQLTFTLVNSFESDPTADRLSVNSPLGQAILGKQVSDKVTVAAPSGQTEYTIVAIE